MYDGMRVWTPIAIDEFELIEGIRCGGLVSEGVPVDFIREVANDVLIELEDDQQLADKYLYPCMDAIFDKAESIVRRKYAESETDKE